MQGKVPLCRVLGLFQVRLLPGERDLRGVPKRAASGPAST